MNDLQATKRKKPPLEPLAVNITDAATLLGAHRNTVTRLVNKGVLVPVVIPGGMKRIRVSDIRTLIDDPPADVRVARRKAAGR